MKMTKRWHSRRGMHTAEYAICFGLVVAAVVGMQTFVKRAIQGRIKAGTDVMVQATSGDIQGKPISSLTQYEPYYQDSSQTVDRDSAIQEIQTVGQDGTDLMLSHQEVSRQVRHKESHQSELGAAPLKAGDDKLWR